MSINRLASGTLMASLAFAPLPAVVTPAHADSKDVVAGLIVGGLLGAAINEDRNRRKVQPQPQVRVVRQKPRATISSAQRAENAEVQQGLNYFGYPVGTADGVLGAKSRAAIRDYQAFLGNGMSGELTRDERTILLTAHARAKAGGPVVQNVVAGSGYGVRGLLLAQRDEMLGYTQPQGMMAAAQPVQQPQAVPALPVPAAAPQVAAAAAAPFIAPEGTQTPAMPSFMDANSGNGALSGSCNQIQLEASTRGGYATAETMSDANAALGEQFCLTRAAVIASGQTLASKVSGVSASDIATQCASFGRLMQDQIAAVSLRAAPDVLTGVEAFILNAGMQPAQLSGTAKVCLGVGYERDQMDVAMGSALLLTAMGETSYAELIGHHLARGFGATQRNDLAFGWYEIALAGMSAGDRLVPGAKGRDAVVRKAAYTISGRSDEALPKSGPEVLPSFAITPDLPQREAFLAPAPAPAPVPAAGPAPTAQLSPDSAHLTPTAATPGQAAEILRNGAEIAAVAAKLPLMLFAGP